MAGAAHPGAAGVAVPSAVTPDGASDLFSAFLNNTPGGGDDDSRRGRMGAQASTAGLQADAAIKLRSDSGRHLHLIGTSTNWW